MVTRRELLTLLPATMLAGCSTLTSRNPSQIPDYDVPVEIRNDDAQGHTVSITVIGGDGTEYAIFFLRVAPNDQKAIRPFQDLQRTGEDAFTVEVRLHGESTTRTEVEMNRCFVVLTVRIDQDAHLESSASVC